MEVIQTQAHHHHEMAFVNRTKECNNIAMEMNEEMDCNDEEVPTKCNYLGCDYTFPNRFNLRRHVMLKHCQLRPFACSLCEARFSLPQHLRIHYKVHSPEETAGLTPLQRGQKLTIKPYLPIFKVEYGDESDLLKNHIDRVQLPAFITQGLLPRPF